MESGLSDRNGLSRFRDCPVLVTGHTGFKGFWLSTWLSLLGARVYGFSLDPAIDHRSFLDPSAVGESVEKGWAGDIRDLALLARVLKSARPRIVFHLAAQPLVRRSYGDPLETLTTNVMGTANLLEAVRDVGDEVRALIVVTSDKAYENRGLERGYSEGDALGGHDPYSASKGCAELVTNSYRLSFFADARSPLIASARSGNVIGGGDWSDERLVPDLVKAVTDGRSAGLRNPEAIRPWQHVLEPLYGYLVLGARLLAGDRQLAGAWNFGPAEAQRISVSALADAFVSLWGGGQIKLGKSPDELHEAGMLLLDSSKAAAELGWLPQLTFPEGMRLTVDWYRRVLLEGAAPTPITREQIGTYVEGLGGAAP